MKKLFILAFVATMSVASYAQVEAKHFYLEPQAGIGIAKYSGGNQSTDTKVGFIGGFELGYQFTEHIGTSIGALYSMQGGKGASGSQLSGQDINLNYLNVPILFQYSPIEFITIKAGVQPGFLISEKFAGKSTNYCNSFDLAIPVGVSFEYSKIVLDARYNIGVTSISRDKSESFTNKVIQITLGYKFQL